MHKRRLFLGVILFVLAVVILVLLNRYSFFLGRVRRTIPPVPKVTLSSPYVVEFWDAKGKKRGQLTAKTYSPLPDGTLDCRGVSLALAGTTIGDVTLTCEKALVKFDTVGRKIEGKVTLSGDVAVNATSGGKTTASGRFETVTYDATARHLTAEGPFDAAWGDGVSLTGRDLAGTVDPAGNIRLDVARDVKLTLPGAFVNGPVLSMPAGAPAASPLRVTCSGPMVLDTGQSFVSFADAVTVEGADLSMKGDSVRLAFTTSPAQQGKLPTEWQAKSIDINGQSEVTAGKLRVAGNHIFWEGQGGRAKIEGEPGRFSDDERSIEAPLVDAVLSDQGEVLSVKATGGGKVKLPAPGRMMGGDPALPATSEPLQASWKDSMEYDAAKGLLALAGDAAVDQPPYHITASTIKMLVARAGGSKVSSFEATKDVSFTDGARSVTAAVARYSSADDCLTLQGSPAVIAMEGAKLESREFTYDVGSKLLSAERQTRLELAGESAAGAQDIVLPGAGGPITVTAARLQADLSGAELVATGARGVKVDSPDGELNCETMTVTGVPLNRTRAPDAKDATADAKPAVRDVHVEGQGNVRFTRQEFVARGQSIFFDESAGTVVMKPADGQRIEITYGGILLMWADSVTVVRARDQVACEKPQIVLTTEGDFMGFGVSQPRGAASSSAAQVKVYLTAGGKMLMTRTSPDKAVLAFDGGVTGRKADVKTGLESRITAETLTLDVDVLQRTEGGQKGQPPRASIAGAHAAGTATPVTVRHVTAKEVLQGKGTSFDWDRAASSGRLAGSPAVVSRGDAAPLSGDEFIYDFTTKNYVVRGLGPGKIVVPR